MAAAGDMLVEDEKGCPPFIRDRSHSYASTLLGNISMFKQNGELTDVEVQLEKGKTIRCHKILLAAASPYMKHALIYGKLDALDLTDQDGDVIECVLDYIYSGRLHVEYELLFEFLNVTDFLQMNDVKEECAEYLGKHITPRLCLSCYPLAGRMNLGALQYSALDNIAIYFAALAEEPEFMQFDHKELRIVFELPNLQVVSEDQVLDLLVRWTVHDNENRGEQHFERLLQFVKIPCVSNAMLTVISCTKKPAYRPMKQAIMRRLQYLNKIKDTKPESLPKVRDSVQCESMFIVEKGGIWAARLWPRKKEKFEHMKHLPYNTATKQFGVSLLPHGFILTGGKEQQLSLDEVFVFNLYNHSWARLPHMLTERDGHVALSYGHGAVMVACGSRSYSDNTRPDSLQTEQLMSVDMLNLLEFKWERLCTVPVGYHCSDGAICGDILYLTNVTDAPRAAAAAAPTTSTAPQPLVRCDLKTNGWDIKRTLPNRPRGSARHYDGKGGRLVSILDRLYLIDAQVPGLWKYEPDDDAWTELATPMFDSCHLARPVFWRGRLYVAREDGPEIDEYDVKTDKWCLWENSKLQQPMQVSSGYILAAGPHY